MHEELHQGSPSRYCKDHSQQLCDITYIDYCNCLLAGAPQYQLNRLQAVMNSAGRLICGLSKFDHISQVLHDRLHWLAVPQRIRYKLCLLVYKALHGLAPQYLTDFCQPLSLVSGRSSTPLPWLPVLANIEPPALRRKAATDRLVTKVLTHDHWPIHHDILNPPQQRLTSRKPLWCVMTPTDIESQWRES